MTDDVERKGRTDRKAMALIGAIVALAAASLAAQDGQWLMAMLNVVLSVIIGFLGVWLGVATGRAIA